MRLELSTPDMETSSSGDEGCSLRDSSRKVSETYTDRVTWLDPHCPARRQNLVSKRLKYFEALANGDDPDQDNHNHVYSSYEVKHHEVSESSLRDISESLSETDGCDDGTSEALTINSTELSEDYPTLPSEENSHKDYGFYTVFPGLPDDELDTCEFDSEAVEEEVENNKSIEELCNVIKNEIDRMSELTLETNLSSESENVNENFISENNLVTVKGPSNDLLQTVTKENESKSNSIIRDLNGTINEILTTERTYVDDLDYVCKSYMSEMYSNDLPAFLEGKCSDVFGNFEKIKDFHKNEFLPALEKCDADPEAICKVFTDFIDKLYCYTEYALNKPRSNKLIRDGAAFFEKARIAIGDVMGLSSFLLKPLQRLVKYRQLIERIGKNLKKLEIDDVIEYSGFLVKSKAIEYSPALKAALEAEKALTDLQQQGNDVLMVPFISKCPFPVENLRLAKSAKLVINKKSIKYQIFLFETLILFTEPINMNNEELFLYKDYISLDRIQPPVECQKSQNSFTITSSENKSRIFHIKCVNADERASWLSAIRSILFKQMQALKEAIKRKTSESASLSKENSESTKPCSIQIPPISKCPHNLDDMGQLRKCGKLTITHKNCMNIGQVILYEKVLIFTSVVNHHYEELLNYESSILAEHLCIAQSLGDSAAKFHVWCNRSKASFILQAKTTDVKAAWIKQLDRVIGEQEALRLRNSMAGREEPTATRTAPIMRSLRGVPGECNRRSLPPISTIWHLALDFDDNTNSSGSANDLQQNGNNSKYHKSTSDVIQPEQNNTDTGVGDENVFINESNLKHTHNS